MNDDDHIVNIPIEIFENYTIKELKKMTFEEFFTICKNAGILKDNYKKI